MSMIVLLPLIVIVVSLVFYLGYKLLFKIQFQLNGTETLLFQFAYICIFFGFYYENIVNFGNLLIPIGIIFLIILGYYYLLRMIKTKLYIKWQLFIIYILMFFVQGYALSFIPMDGWDSLGYAIIFILFVGSTLIYLLIINFITFIIRKVKKINYKNNTLMFKKELIVSLIAIALFLPIIYGLSFEKKIIYEDIKREEIAKEKALDYLNKKYGNGEFKIIERIDDEYNEYFLFTVSTKYLDTEFNIDLNYDDLTIFDEDFIFKYYSEELNEEILNYNQLESYIENYLRLEMLNKYNIDVEYTYINFDEELFEKTYFGEIPSFDKLNDFIDKEIEEITILKIFSENEINEFCEYIINLYEELEHEETILWFKFNYDNPYSSSLHYKDDGYLRNDGNRYLVYVDASPVHVKK